MTILRHSTLLPLIRLSLAGVVPTGPGPNDVFTAGGFCMIDWKTDTTMTWTNMTIDLMSGSNDNMTWVDTVARGMDGTDPSLAPYNWTCPDVDPYGPIYFYQFMQYTAAETQWTARFTITSSSGEKDPAVYSSQPSGAQIPWGNGVLRAGSVNTTQSDSSDTPPGVRPDSLSDSSVPTTSTELGGRPLPSGRLGLSDASYSRNSTATPTRSKRPRPRPSSTPLIAAPTLDAPSDASVLRTDDLYTNSARFAACSCVYTLLSMSTITIMCVTF